MNFLCICTHKSDLNIFRTIDIQILLSYDQIVNQLISIYDTRWSVRSENFVNINWNDIKMRITNSIAKYIRTH